MKRSQLLGKTRRLGIFHTLLFWKNAENWRILPPFFSFLAFRADRGFSQIYPLFQRIFVRAWYEYMLGMAPREQLIKVKYRLKIARYLNRLMHNMNP